MDDPRFAQGVALFNERDFLEASECFEDLYFEAVRDEVDFVRVFMQFSVGAYHAQVGQWRPAVERIEEGVRVAAHISNDCGVDIAGLAAAMAAAARAIRRAEKPEWPQIVKAEG